MSNLLSSQKSIHSVSPLVNGSYELPTEVFVYKNDFGHTSYTILKMACGILGLVHNI